MKIRGVLDPGQAALHHKLMVIDETIVVAGSFNYTQPANDFNDANLFVLGSPFPEVAGVNVDAANSQALAGHMKAEIERIITNSTLYTPS
jgi:phosphatidylserine/phosphatidylglycerophosphate/cardiolipin synthase-like enzyme